MKKTILYIFLTFFGLSFAQNGIIGDGFGQNDWSNTDCFSASAGNSRIFTTTANGTGDRYFRLVTCWDNNWNQWGPSNNSDTSLNYNTKYSNSDITEGNTGGAFYTSANSSYNYVFKTREGDATTVNLVIFEVQGTIRSISSLTASYNVSVGDAKTITATLDGELSSGQSVYLRYSTDNWSTSTITEMSGSGISYSADIPAGVNVADANIKYYAFTSGNGLTIAHADADFFTINLENNSGNNYSYSTKSEFSLGYGPFGFSFDSATDSSGSNTDQLVSDLENSNGIAATEWREGNANGSLAHDSSLADNGSLGNGTDGSMKMTHTGNGTFYAVTRKGGNSTYLSGYTFLDGTENETVQTEDKVTVSFWMYSNVTGDNLVRVAFIENGGNSFAGWKNVDTANSWVNYEWTVGNTQMDAIADGLRLRIDFAAGFGSGGIAYIDDITVKGLDVVWSGANGASETNGSNWSSGFVPSKYEDIVINSAPTNELYIAGRNSTTNKFEVNNVYVNNGGHLKIRNSKYGSGNNFPRTLYVNGNYNNKSGAKTTVDQGSEIYINGNLTDGTTTADAQATNYIKLISDSDQFSSLIVNGTYTNGGNGNKIKYDLFINDVNNGWDLKGSPLLSGNVQGSAFAQNGSQYGIKTYNNTTNTFTASTTQGTNSLTNGVGYAMAKDNSGSGGTVQITGGVYTSFSTLVGLTSNVGNGSGGSHWNLLSNPYSSFIALNNLARDDSGAGGSIWQKNSGVLGYTNAQANIYRWNATNYSDVVNASTSTAEYAAPGQGFFISYNPSNTAGSDDSALSDFTFQENFQTTLDDMGTFESDDNITGDIINDRAELYLNLEQNTLVRDTKLIFMNGVSNEIDRGYDAAPFEGDDNSHMIYSRIPEYDEGIDLILQALP